MKKWKRKSVIRIETRDDDVDKWQYTDSLKNWDLIFAFLRITFKILIFVTGHICNFYSLYSKLCFDTIYLVRILNILGFIM